MGVRRMRRWDVLERWIKENGWKRGAELGVFKGDTYLYLLSTCRELELIGVDVWEPRQECEEQMAPGGRTYASHDLAAYEHHVRGASEKYGPRSQLIKGTTLDSANLFSNGYFDFVFIDADHTYEGVSADIKAWKPKVKLGGTISGHDANNPPFPGIARALNELCPGWSEYPDHVWRWDIVQ